MVRGYQRVSCIQKALALPIHDAHLSMTHDNFYRMLREKAPNDIDKYEAIDVTTCLVGGKDYERGDDRHGYFDFLWSSAGALFNLFLGHSSANSKHALNLHRCGRN